MLDLTEATRREMVAEINTNLSEREEREKRDGQTWNTAEMKQAFEAHGFLAPFINVTRKSEGVRGFLEFQHQPRYYYNFTEE